jgi:hypothetical protein
VRPYERIAIASGVSRLPYLASEIKVVQIPYDASAEHFMETERPEFVAVIPSREPRDPLLPEHVYGRLRDGSLGYSQILGVDGPRLLPVKTIGWVNPTIKVFVRSDLRARIPKEMVRLEVLD